MRVANQRGPGVQAGWWVQQLGFGAFGVVEGQAGGHYVQAPFQNRLFAMFQVCPGPRIIVVQDGDVRQRVNPVQAEKSSVPSSGGTRRTPVLQVKRPGAGDRKARHDFSVGVPGVGVRVVDYDQMVRESSLPCDGRKGPFSKESRPVVGGNYGGNGGHNKRPRFQSSRPEG